MQAQKTAINWDAVPQQRLGDLTIRQIISGEGLMLVKLTMKAGAIAKRHSHPNEQMTYILKVFV